MQRPRKRCGAVLCRSNITGKGGLSESQFAEKVGLVIRNFISIHRTPGEKMGEDGGIPAMEEVCPEFYAGGEGEFREEHPDEF